MTGMFELQAIAQMSATQIVSCLLEGTLIALIAALVLRLSPRQSSGTRFVVWFSALMAIAALPFLTNVVRWHGVAPAAGTNRPAITLPSSWALYLFSVWAVIAMWCLVRVGAGLWHLHVLRESCVPIDPAHLRARLRETLEHNRGTRLVSLCTSDRVQVPTAIGLITPAVVVPGWVMEELSLDELNQILLHELAHLRRWDDWTNLAQKVVKALFFFHPAVWWIEKNISLEREMACDDAVLAETARPHAYAACLAHMAEKTLVRRSLALAQAALGRLRHTSLRVAQILDTNRPRGAKPGWRFALSLGAGFVIACSFLASKEPRLIAFQDVRPDSVGPAIASFVKPAIAPVPMATRTAARTVRASSQPRLPRVVMAKDKRTNAGAVRREFEGVVETTFVVAAPIAEPTLVHFTDSGSMTSSEAFFLLVADRERGSYGQVYEVQVWRVTVRHLTVHSASKEIPRKET